MFARQLFQRSISGSLSRSFHMSGAMSNKVAVLGAAGGIGQPLSLLLKLDNNVKELSLYDIQGTPGVAADLSHCSTQGGVKGYQGDDQLGEALKGCDVVVIPAGVPRKPGMTRDDLFNTNASIVQTLASACAKHCPKAMMCIISNPVNSTVPIVAETFKKAGVYDPKRVFGVTTLDVVRARTFVSENQGTDVNNTNVTVIGGHAGITILPLLSQVKGGNFSDDEIAALSHRIQFGGDEVVKAKDGAGSATLSMAYAGYLFVQRLLAAMNGEKNVVECTFTENNVTPLKFFSTPTELGPNGVERHLDFGKLSKFEQDNFDKMLPDLEKQIQKGIDFATK